jgi:hypothetical protein
MRLLGDLDVRGEEEDRRKEETERGTNGMRSEVVGDEDLDGNEDKVVLRSCESATIPKFLL